MGNYLRPGTNECYDFSPDDTEDCFYVHESDSICLMDIMEKATKKWPGISLEEILINAEHIHTYALGYDQYDSSDYTNYLVITRRKE